MITESGADVGALLDHVIDRALNTDQRLDIPAGEKALSPRTHPAGDDRLDSLVQEILGKETGLMAGVRDLVTG